MIRVSNHKPKLYFVPAHNDMGHFYPSYYDTSDFYYMELYDYLEKKEFNAFDMKRNLTKEEVLAIANGLDYSDLGTTLAYPWACEMNRLIKRADGQLWQFNAVSSDLNNRIRCVIVLGGNELCRWSLFDANVKLPILKMAALFLNSLRGIKNRKEIANWEKFYIKMHHDFLKNKS